MILRFTLRARAGRRTGWRSSAREGLPGAGRNAGFDDDPRKLEDTSCARVRREADRAAIQRAGGFPVLVGLLGSGPAAELTEYAVAVLGNLAAGGHALKDALRDVRPYLLGFFFGCGVL